ncbi:malonyl-CoA decarboxylase [Jannaschia donghaensis]|uniref:Malonyl-CoA decarboxylase (MCD) n=1 Tax=Jannaschia donghaensis TaxID=420998 RepID=A0A0M6YEZ5_9RHOB|nr:malonyl-CoA decarboxylase [Jannaschia donghaensis]CTQ48530.1 Malonyl-CoA decarboxylase (MCD) [Jannaschia donghaensis]
MTTLAGLLSTVFDRRYVGSAAGDRRDIMTLCSGLMAARDEVSGMDLARRVLDRYRGLDDDARAAFFGWLAGEMEIDAGKVATALADYSADPTPLAHAALMTASEPPRQDLFRRLNRVPGATGQLVEMRADLRRAARTDGALTVVDADLSHLLRSWFNRGFLVLRPVNWDSPASLLQKIIEYEAVHTIDSWDDLRRRLQPADRRCFAFFHPAMPDEPLIFVEVALTRGIPGKIGALLAEDRVLLPKAQADTAVFYSISNCQPGLAGISFGNLLIKQVVADLTAELPGLRTFVTLSPIPGLADWLTAAGVAPADDAALRQAAAHYLTRERRGALPRDPVARFHLGNGATIHDIHADADPSASGQRQSRGAMVNYLYEPDRIAKNLEGLNEGRIAATRSVQSLARQAQIPEAQA